jgi:hypothetical protein
MIRKATPADIPAIVELGLEAMNKGAYPNMVISREKIEAMARECVSSAQNFSWVAEKNGIVGGVLCALVHDCMFYERRQATVVQFYSHLPGEGMNLLRKLKRWWQSRPGVKMIVFSLEHDADPRIGKILQRMGFFVALPVYLITK